MRFRQMLRQILELDFALEDFLDTELFHLQLHGLPSAPAVSNLDGMSPCDGDFASRTILARLSTRIGSECRSRLSAESVSQFRYFVDDR